MANCTTCPKGQIQPEAGQMECIDCSTKGRIKTSNEGHTECIDNEALYSASVIDAMFSKGISLSAAFGISAIFTFVCGFMQYLREKAPGDSLGQIKRMQVLIKSAPQGFSFGSELFLVAGMLYEAPRIAAVMIVFRIMHPLTVMYVLLAMFGKMTWTKRLVADSDEWKDLIHADFAEANIPAVGAVTVLSMCDVTMVQMLPWKNIEFYKKSNGFPTTSIMHVCLGVETVQSAVSVLCQTIFLCSVQDVNDPLMSVQAKVLFGLNMCFSTLTVIISVVMMFFKQVLLKETKQVSATPEVDTALEIGSLYGDSTDTISMYDNPSHEQNANAVGTEHAELEAEIVEPNYRGTFLEHYQSTRGSSGEVEVQVDAGLEMGSLYGDSTDTINMYDNPLHEQEASAVGTEHTDLEG